MGHALLGLLLVTATAGLAQNRPSLTWEGDVNGTAILRIQNDHVEVDNQRASSVSQTRFRFASPLPPDAAVQVENRLGGASVRVLEQPHSANNQTALVEIVTRGQAPQRVSLDFYWDDRRISRRSQDVRRSSRSEGYQTRGRASARNTGEASGSATWAGEVDNEVFVLLRGRQMLSTTVRGRAVSNQQMDVTTALPRRDIAVNLENVQGRGEVHLAEQPSAANNYTAKVRIHDPENGAGSYRFTLSWAGSWAESSSDAYGDSPSYPAGGILTPGGRVNDQGFPSDGVYGSGNTARWAGQVDGRVRVHFRGNRAWTERLSGAETRGDQASFGSPLPRGNVNVDVNKIRGRGDVAIVQRPSANNNYTLTMEINDSEGGSDLYDLEVRW